MANIYLALLFAGLAASSAWQAGKRGWGYIKTGRDFVQFDSTKNSGERFLLAGSLWTAGAVVMGIVTLVLLGFAVFYWSTL